MQKIPSLFKRDYNGNRQVYDEVVPGSGWVVNGEGIPTLKLDGTCCKIEDGILYKRYDRKLTKNANKKLKAGGYTPKIEDYKPAPEGWQPAEPEPNQHTGHWPGWVQVQFDAPEDKWHVEAHLNTPADRCASNGTYELVGPKVQGNPYSLDDHYLWKHGQTPFTHVPRDFERLREFFKKEVIEGIVWHHPDGRMVKIKRRDFGLDWPVL